MRSIMWPVIITSFLAAAAVAQKECSDDVDCMGNQYCYKFSKTCVNYTLCSRYNREEAAKPSREARDCGKCLKGYFAEETPEPYGEVAESCTKDRNAVEQGGHKTVWIWFGTVVTAVIIVGGLLWVIHAMIRCKSPCEDQSATEPEKPGLLMVENGFCASAPPAPLCQNMNNNKYHDAEETNPLSTPREYYGNFAVDTSRPVKAQGYHPPNYIRTDPSYNPGDNQTNEATFSPPDIDEETIPSEWTPSQPTGGIPVQPFASISEAAEDNATNAVLQRLTCPSPSTGQDGEGQENNNSSENSRGFGNNDRTGNTRGNANSNRIYQVVQVVNLFNQGSNGS